MTVLGRQGVSIRIWMKMMINDDCIMASRLYGWNVIICVALRVGIGIIASDQAVSDELITATGAQDLVVPVDSSKSLAKSLPYSIDKPQIVKKWKEYARLYAKYMLCEFLLMYLGSSLLIIWIMHFQIKLFQG